MGGVEISLRLEAIWLEDDQRLQYWLFHQSLKDTEALIK